MNASPIAAALPDATAATAADRSEAEAVFSVLVLLPGHSVGSLAIGDLFLDEAGRLFRVEGPRSLDGNHVTVRLALDELQALQRPVYFHATHAVVQVRL